MKRQQKWHNSCCLWLLNLRHTCSDMFRPYCLWLSCGLWLRSVTSASRRGHCHTGRMWQTDGAMATNSPFMTSIKEGSVGMDLNITCIRANRQKKSSSPLPVDIKGRPKNGEQTDLLVAEWRGSSWKDWRKNSKEGRDSGSKYGTNGHPTLTLHPLFRAWRRTSDICNTMRPICQSATPWDDQNQGKGVGPTLSMHHFSL